MDVTIIDGVVASLDVLLFLEGPYVFVPKRLSELLPVGKTKVAEICGVNLFEGIFLVGSVADKIAEQHGGRGWDVRQTHRVSGDCSAQVELGIPLMPDQGSRGPVSGGTWSASVRRLSDDRDEDCNVAGLRRVPLARYHW